MCDRPRFPLAGLKNLMNYKAVPARCDEPCRNLKRMNLKQIRNARTVSRIVYESLLFRNSFLKRAAGHTLDRMFVSSRRKRRERQRRPNLLHQRHGYEISYLRAHTKDARRNSSPSCVFVCAFKNGLDKPSQLDFDLKLLFAALDTQVILRSVLPEHPAQLFKCET
jgi:hypothetical protein